MTIIYFSIYKNLSDIDLIDLTYKEMNKYNELSLKSQNEKSSNLDAMIKEIKKRKLKLNEEELANRIFYH